MARAEYLTMLELCALWTGWCAMHSILIDTSVLGLVKKHAAGLSRYYRLLYNGWSCATLLPLIIVTRQAGGEVIFSWDGYPAVGRLLLLSVTLLLFSGGAARYDMCSFLGIRQLRTGARQQLLSGSEEFVESGVFGLVRHPWYAGSLLFLWSMLPRYSLPVFLSVCILSLYLVIGTFLEERKIVSLYGDSYRQYQGRVSMLFPWKWLRRRLF